MGENPGQVWLLRAGESVTEEEEWEQDNGEQVDQKEDRSEDSAAEAKAGQYLEPMAKLLFRIWTQDQGPVDRLSQSLMELKTNFISFI